MPQRIRISKTKLTLLPKQIFTLSKWHHKRHHLVHTVGESDIFILSQNKEKKQGYDAYDKLT